MEEGEGFTGLAWLAINVSCSTVAGRIKASFNTHVSVTLKCLTLNNMSMSTKLWVKFGIG